MNYYIIWFTDNNGKEEYETYAIMQFENIDVAWKKAYELFGDTVISVERYNP